MKPHLLTALLAFCASLAMTCSSLTADQNVGLIQPRLFSTEDTRAGLGVSYLGQSAVNGRIVLDANNGFFDKTVFRAEGQRAVPAAERSLISAHFSHLVHGGGEGTARWHLWIADAGSVRVDLAMIDPQGKSSWNVSLAGQTKRFNPADPKPITFSLAEVGKHVLKLSPVAGGDARGNISGTQISKLTLSGTAITNSKLLRARWRPAAVHARYSSSTCASTKLWVFESQNASQYSSYSPMTTQFGYFGASFSADSTAAGGVNFSMWAANSKATKAPPIGTMPHLLATGNPAADFGGFGHEGSGVKIRNWEPYAHHPRSVIQALRIQSDGEWNTFSGYLFDQRSQNWVLYAQGRKSTANVKRRKNDGAVQLRPASFCEIPGPPARERTGDRVRTMRRRGWFYGEDQRWHRVDEQAMKSGNPTNKLISAQDGWLTMSTGGMAMVKTPASIKLNDPNNKLPVYLQPSKTAQLHETPVTFGQSDTSSVTANSAKVSYQFTKPGTDANAVLHYGTVDCLTFVRRKLHGTEKKGVSDAMLAAERTWQHATERKSVSGNEITFNLQNLKPSTQYFYRVLVTNAEGKSWALESGDFRTGR